MVGLLVLVARRPGEFWPLHGAAIGLILGVAAACIDEPCADIVDVGPRPLWWRNAVRAVGPLVLVVGWLVTHWLLRSAWPGHFDVLAVQGIVAAMVGVGAAVVGRATGRSEPGALIAATTVPLVVAVALARPFASQVPIFPVWAHEDWSLAARIWLSLGSVAGLGLAWVTRRDAMGRTSDRN